MSKTYNGKRTIAVLELSSTALKALIGTPKDFKKEPDKLNRFKSKVLPFSMHTYISNANEINLIQYKQNIIPELRTMIKWIYGFSPQAFKIVLTGLYRNIINWNDFHQLLLDEISHLKRFEIPEIELLTSQRESYLSFISWFNTTLKKKDDETTFDEFFIFNNGLNIDVGGGTTEITFIKQSSFDNTISIPIGSDILKQEILNTKYIDNKHFWGFIIDLEKRTQIKVQSFLERAYQNPLKPKFCICTGSNIIVEGGDEFNGRNKVDVNRIDWQLKEYRSTMDQIIFGYLFAEKSIPDRHEKFIKRYCAYIIFKEIASHFKFDNYYINNANLRIGVFYDLISKLKAK